MVSHSETSEQARARSRLHLDFYTDLASARAEAEDLLIEASADLARANGVEEQLLLRATAAAAQNTIDLIDNAIGKWKRPPQITQVAKTLREQAEVRSRGTAVAIVLLALRWLERTGGALGDLSPTMVDALRDAAIPHYTAGVFGTLEELPRPAELDSRIARLIDQAEPVRKLDGPVSAAVTVVARLRGKDPRTIWRAWREIEPPSI